MNPQYPLPSTPENNLIGKTTGDNFICEISLYEIQKVMENTYGGSSCQLYREVKVGQDIDIANGYNFHYKVVNACKGMQDAYKAFESTRESMMKFTDLLISNTKHEETML